MNHERKNEFGVEHNPNKSWANLDDEKLQDAILQLAGENHISCAADNPRLSKFADFLDIFASAWLEQKARVEEQAGKYGFSPCTSTAEIPAEDRHKVALLSLTLNGSFVLLGNGCLSSSGGSGQYEKIPLRKDGKATSMRVEDGVIVLGEATMRTRLHVTRGGGGFIGNTSQLQALFYTKDTLPADNILQLRKALSESVSQFSQTVRGDLEETFRRKPLEEFEDEPKKIPEFEPVY
ncbi:hypothetical protein EXS65_04585 [Candidatus Peribacteria bacterium]|nr:hypothetical protein [Candidatus Peribacteria bacterium]